jgi:transposase InsO family protein
MNILARNIERYIWKSVVYNYGIPYAFVTDNGKQFDCESFQEWCAKLHIKNYYLSPGHLQANGQVEATNKTIFKILKKKLSDRKGDWAEDLPKVHCAYRTTKRTSTEETLYALAFGPEAVIIAEVGSGSYRVETFCEDLDGKIN